MQNQNKILGNFNRNNNPATGSLLTGVFNNPDNVDSLLFLTKNEFTYTIVDADLLHNNSTEICSISSYDFCFLKIAEDLSWVFVGSRKNPSNYYG